MYLFLIIIIIGLTLTSTPFEICLVVFVCPLSAILANKTFDRNQTKMTILQIEINDTCITKINFVLNLSSHVYFPGKYIVFLAVFI